MRCAGSLDMGGVPHGCEVASSEHRATDRLTAQSREVTGSTAVQYLGGRELRAVGQSRIVVRTYAHRVTSAPCTAKLLTQ